MRHSFLDAVRDAWNDREIPMWIASTVLHLAILLIASRMLIREEAPIAADLQTRILETPEPEEIEEEPEIELPPIEEPKPEQDEIIQDTQPDAPPDSVEIPNAPEPVPATLSPVDKPPIDTITAELAEGPNPIAQAAKGAGGILNSRGKGKAGLLASQGGSKETEDAVHWGLDWLVRHQFEDGHWQLDHTPRAKGPTSGAGKVRSHMAATAMGTLPFLASGFHHRGSMNPKENNIYKRNVFGALSWMVKNQQGNGLLLAQGDQYTFYTHGLATIALCEAYALTKDDFLLGPCQKAVKFLIDTQNQKGGWRYAIGDGDCDSSVLGWQVMGLKSATMGGIEVPSIVFDKCRGFLETVRTGAKREQFGYLVDDGQIKYVNPRCETAIGHLCYQYMGVTQRNDPSLQAGVAYMLAHPVSMQARDAYYWYYANQVIHNFQGPEWDQWNRVMKEVLTTSQNTEKGNTDHGSWDPNKPTKDAHADPGGRHMVTCLHILCLEIYYRYMPLYGMKDEPPPAPAAGESPSPPPSSDGERNEAGAAAENPAN
jgi:hypothetical protein